MVGILEFVLSEREGQPYIICLVLSFTYCGPCQV